MALAIVIHLKDKVCLDIIGFKHGFVNVLEYF